MLPLLSTPPDEWGILFVIPFCFINNSLKDYFYLFFFLNNVTGKLFGYISSQTYNIDITPITISLQRHLPFSKDQTKLLFPFMTPSFPLSFRFIHRFFLFWKGNCNCLYNCTNWCRHLFTREKGQTIWHVTPTPNIETHSRSMTRLIGIRHR